MNRSSDAQTTPDAGPSRVPMVHVPLDGSPAAAVALPVAAALADVIGGTIHIVHAGPAGLPREEAARWLGLRPDDLQGRVLDVVEGGPVDAIVRIAASHESLLLVMSTHGTGPEPPDGLGPVTRGVLPAAPCPVVLVRPEIAAGLGHFALRHMLLPLDGSPGTMAVLGPAVELALIGGASVDVLHVASLDGGRPPEPEALTTPRYLDQPQHEWPAWSREFLDRVCETLGSCPAIPLRLSLSHGDPAAEILRLAGQRPADLIVLAWNGALEGSRAATLKAVLRAAPCPVMVVRTAKGAARQGAADPHAA